VGYSIFGAVAGFEPVFGDLARFVYTQPIHLAYCTALGLACGLVGILYARCFYRTARVFHAITVPPAAKPAIGGLAVGLMGLATPSVLSIGYGWIQIAMTPTLLSLPLWVILLPPFAKIVAISLSIGFGGSGGVLRKEEGISPMVSLL
jgi:CIC family chloride channel protein